MPLKRFKKELKRPCSPVQLIIFLIVFLLYVFGVFTHLFAKSLDNFRYPLDIDLPYAIKQIEKDPNSLKHLQIDNFNYNYINVPSAKQFCEPLEASKQEKTQSISPYVIILVKSRYNNFKQRDAIRKTWGSWSSQNEIRPIRTVFLLGIPENRDDDEEKRKFQLETTENNDILQQDFVDTYFNNTKKTFMGIRWVNEQCFTAQFYVFIDDDFYLNPRLLVTYLATNVTESMQDSLFAGYVFPNSTPMRHWTSKWYISLEEYPFRKFPPFVAAGCVIYSRASVRKFWLASSLVRKFRFDDIYLAIIAKKLEIEPLHLPMVHYYAPKYSADFYKNSVIAAHEFTSDDLLTMWTDYNV